jgi:CRP/FNR family transcriptional regulator, cyclic AMP receptor protein
MADEDHLQLLKNLPLFGSLMHDDLEALSKRLEHCTFDAGAVIFRQGDEGGRLYIIEDGEVEISYGEDKGTVTLATLFAGQYFGELSLLDGEPRSATATAVKACKLVALDREDFVEFLTKDPDAALLILAETADRMRQTNALFSRQVSRNVLEEAEERVTFGQYIADRVASFGGSWTFIGLFSLVMAIWMTANELHGVTFDPFPFILLNLVLSTLAALQAPVIMMSQNRQASKDKLLAQNDYQVNLKSEIGIESLLKGQAELRARLALLERRQGPNSLRNHSS